MREQLPLDFRVQETRLQTIDPMEFDAVNREEHATDKYRQETQIAFLAVVDGERRLRAIEQSAKQASKSAASLEDQKRAAKSAAERNEATKNAYRAQVVARASRDRLSYAKERVKELEMWLSWAKCEELAAQARIEEAKARLLKRSGTPRSDFSLTSFQNQRKERNRQAQLAEYLASKQGDVAKSAKQKWKESAAHAARILGSVQQVVP